MKQPQHRRPPTPVDALRLFRRYAWQRLRKLLYCLLGSSVVLMLPMPGLSGDGQIAAFIFVLAALLWITEAIPLYATSLLVVALEVVFLARPGAPDGDPNAYKMYFAAGSDPIIVLFFGGFLLARSATRYKLDIAMANWLLRPFRGQPSLMIMGVMSITAVFSMWMSNTATTAMMLAIVHPMLQQLPKESGLRKALVLAVPFGANIGGIGTPIGTPPNAVVIASLRRMGIEISFLQWMLLAVPLVVLLLAAAWLLLKVYFKVKSTDQMADQQQDVQLPLTAYVVAAVFGATVLLWLTSELHGIPTAVVALLPAVVFTALCILDADDVNTLDWNVLILIAGGISLGTAMQQTGLDEWIIGLLPVGSLPPTVTVAMFSLTAVCLSMVMSNTAAANLIAPVALGIGAISSTWMGITLALACSAAMALPVSTPPNALAYATGAIDSKDMIKVGGVISFGIVIIVLLTIHPILGWWNLL